MNEIFMYTVWSTIAVAAVLSSVFLFRLLAGLGPLIVRIETIAQWLEAGRPRYDRILSDLEAQLGELRGLSESAHRVAGNVESISDGLRSAAQPIIDEVRDLSRTARRVHAALAAVRTGLGVLFLHRRTADRGSGPWLETDQES